MPKLKPGTIVPDPAEDKRIHTGIAADPDTCNLATVQPQHLKRVGRPKNPAPKVQVTIRYDSDILEAFQASGPGWQTRMNSALRDWLETHRS